MPPVEYFAVLAKYSAVYVEACENYCKQSWRNRCRILTSNGPMDVTIPIKHTGDIFHTHVNKVMVDYSTPWVPQFEYALESAYYSSPFFEYYRDPLFAILDSHPESLWELDMRLTEFLCSKIGIAPRLIPTREWVPYGQTPDDLRNAIHPKVHSDYQAREYWQVFREKFGFVEGLSVLDLLFNEGPEALSVLI